MNALRWFVCLSAVLSLSCSTTKTQEASATGAEDSSSGESRSQVDRQPATASVEGNRVQFSPDGQWLVFERADDDGTYSLWRMRRDGEKAERIGPESKEDVDDRHPTFDLTGKRIVFASNRDGDFDLYAFHLDDGEVEQLTDMPGDETEPVVSPLRYTFYAAQTNSCTSTGASGRALDGYQKLAFTRSLPDEERTEVWFASITPTERTKQAFRSWNKPPISDEHAVHKGRLSAKGASCRSPSWSADGLSLVWSCGGDENVIHDGPAAWEQSFAAAIEAVRAKKYFKSCERLDAPNWRSDECAQDLPRRYTTFDASAVSTPEDNLSQPSVSANQTVLIAAADDGVMWRPRFGSGEGGWKSLDVGSDSVSYPAWDPHGYQVAYGHTAGEQPELKFHRTNFYLQDVRNLNHFRELLDPRSTRLVDHGFVARPGDWKEFHAYYDKLRYMRRPAFITADAALQAYRDEFHLILQDAESQAADRLHALTGAMYRHFADRYEDTGDATDLYYARYFAAGWAPQEAYRRLEQPSEDLQAAARWNEFRGDEKAEYERLTAPAIERIPEALPDVLEDMPDDVAKPVSTWLDAMLAAEGVGKITVPSYEKPFRIDWSQFKVRGSYAENDKGGYFLTVSWFAMAPLPFDGSLDELREAMQTVQVDKKSAMDVWTTVDSTIGAFMGRPVDPAPQHLVKLAEDDPKMLRSFDGDAVADALREMVGSTAIRDANSASPTTTQRKIKVTFFPKRRGLDSEFFSQLTHPTVPQRGLASSLDVFAVFGVDAAMEHSLSAVESESYAKSYRKTLDKLREKHADFGGDGYVATDIYHSWMATLVTLADHSNMSDEAVAQFAASDAWKDRTLHSALAGYAQLKHAAVLYAAQDFAAECASSTPSFVLVEQPVLPQVRGYVDPQPEFFGQLSDLAGRVYEKMANGNEPSVPGWEYDDDVPLNAKNFAARLEKIARMQMEGEPLSRDDYRWIHVVGGRLEGLSLRHAKYAQQIRTIGDARAQRGVALATDIQTNGVRGIVQQVAVGRLLDLYVAVPQTPGRRMTQGALFTFYEFEQAMSERLTDKKWNRMIEDDKLPARPPWTESFIQSVDVQWQEESDGEEE